MQKAEVQIGNSGLIAQLQSKSWRQYLTGLSGSSRGKRVRRYAQRLRRAAWDRKAPPRNDCNLVSNAPQIKFELAQAQDEDSVMLSMRALEDFDRGHTPFDEPR